MSKLEWMLYPANTFATHAEVWDECGRRNGDSLLLSSEFAAACLTAFGCGYERVAIARAGTQVAAVAILQPWGRGRWATFQPSQAPLGFWVCAPNADLPALLSSLSRKLPGPVLSISLTQQDPAIIPRPRDGSRLKTIDYIQTGKIDVPKDFDAYWSSRSKNTRQNINKARNRIKREGGCLRFEHCDDPGKAEALLSDYGLLESAGWKNRLGTAVSRDNVQGQFYVDLLKRLMPDRAMVWRYLFDEQLVATDLCIHHHGVVYILKTTYDEEFGKYSPAFMMHVDGIHHCSSNGFDTIEFYGPAMDWHKKLTGDLRTLYHINWYRYSLIPAILNLKKRLLRQESG